MNTLNLLFNLNLNLNLNSPSLLPLLPSLPSHAEKAALLFAFRGSGWQKKTNVFQIRCKFQMQQLSNWALAYMVAQYLPTQLPPRRLVIAVSPPGAKSFR